MSEQLQFDAPSYVTIVKLQETTDGNFCYVAFHPELPNTISQGNTSKEATENLVEATELTIAHLVSNGLPIPEPMSFKVASVNDLLSTPEPTYFSFTDVSEQSIGSSDTHLSRQEIMTAPSGQLVPL
ncbi:MAG: type II toxin-antitoxin system HicB family antitoxin [Chloroflexi bacterium]|nr:type II toxin-antitoxin system HicB family antitoxin [Chloroflexota bacterium]